MPLVSVVMPVYNAEQFLSPAIESILEQTFCDFEFIIVDDGSTDRSPQILDQFAQKDRRIRVQHQPRNQGIVATLNWGCQNAQGEYIARMDADDISLPERFAQQVNFLNHNPDVGILGSWVHFIDESNEIWSSTRFPTVPALVKWTLPFYSPLAHPAVMMRRSIIEKLGFYQHWPVEDYELWANASQVTQLANVPLFLFHYRRWRDSLSSQTSDRGEKRADEIVQDILNLLLNHPPPQAVRWVRSMSHYDLAIQKDEYPQASKLLTQLYEAFVEENKLTPEEIKLVAYDVSNKFYRLALGASRYSVFESINLVKRGLQISPLSSEQVLKGLRHLSKKLNRVAG